MHAFHTSTFPGKKNTMYANEFVHMKMKLLFIQRKQIGHMSFNCHG